ncbi:E4 [human papillomavirus 131]|uniref:E4 n=1 Tax=human papillomavirus 131 TaxID=909330 RepID=E7BQ90_9PAPI|nr:E4 [human papillomavirus 131]ADQ85956.1 E4 [human papillomavirus 131]
MGKQVNGLLSLKTKLFLLLSLAPHGLFSSPPPHRPPNSLPPRTPHTGRKALEGDNKPVKTPNRQPQLHPDYDYDDENEENRPPAVPELRNPGWEPTLHQLLQKWDHDLTVLRDTVCRDLEDYKKRLGIHL